MMPFKSKWFIAVMIPILGWFSLSFIKIKLQENIVNKEVGDLEARIAGIEQDNTALEKLIGYLKYPAYLEKKVRLTLNYKAPGEEAVFVYPGTKGKPSSSSLDVDRRMARLPNYMKWVYYLLGY